MTHDPRIDVYLEHAAPFARPILARVRALVHQACPQVEETIKWGMPETPEDLVAALKRDKAARATFDAFPPGCKRECIDWIVESKRAETRAKRLAQTVEWLAEGKRRNWKYENC